MELKGGRSRNIVPDEASCLLKCEDPKAAVKSIALPEQVTAKITDGFFEIVSQRDQYTLYESEKGFNAVSCLLETLGQFGEKNFLMLLI